MHETQRAEGEEVGVTRSATDNVDLSRFVPGTGRLLDRVLQGSIGGLLLSGEQHLCDRTLQDLFPESVALLRRGKADFNLRPEFFHQRCQPPIGSRNQGLKAGAKQPRQHRGGAAAGDGNEHRRAVDNGRHNKTAKLRVVDHVNGNSALTDRRGDLAVNGSVIRGRDHQHVTIKVGGREGSRPIRDLSLRGLFRQSLAQCRRGDGHARASSTQQRNLACGHLATTYDKAGAVSDV